MDITSISSYRFAHTRDDLRLAPGETILAGGTWLMSQPQPDLTGFVDISRLGWEPVEVSADGLRIAASCTIAELVRWSKSDEAPEDWAALPIIDQAANALLASFKIWNTATVGGNICRSFAAASMVSLAVALDGVAEIWLPDGTDRSLPVADLITGNGTNTLEPGEVLRSIWIPAHAMRSRAELSKIALAEHGRSGAVVTGRLEEGGKAVFTITAATLTPQVLRFDDLPGAAALAEAVNAAEGYYTDPLGVADWRRGTSVVLAERILTELRSQLNNQGETA